MLKKLWGLIKNNSLPKQSVFIIEEYEAKIVNLNETPLQGFWRLQNTNSLCKNLIRKVYTKRNLFLTHQK
jgi:hypothetical protein